MKKLIVYLPLFFMILSNCQENKNKKEITHLKSSKEMENKDELIQMLNNQKKLDNEETEDEYKLSQKDLDVLSDLISIDLKNKGYKSLNREDFSKKIKEYFVIELKCINYEEINSRYIVYHGILMDGKEETLRDNLYGSYVDTGNIFFDNKNMLILNFNFLENIVFINGDDISINIPENIIHRNKYLFNDNKASFAWLKANDEYFLESLVTTFGYTKDKDLLAWVMKRNENKAEDFINENLFVKNCKDELEIREGILTYIEETINQGNYTYFNTLYSFYISHDKKIWDQFSEKEQNKMLAYLANTFDYLVMKNKEISYQSNGGWTILGNVFYRYNREDDEKTWNKLVEKFEADKYYGLPHLKEVIDFAYNYESGSY